MRPAKTNPEDEKADIESTFYTSPSSCAPQLNSKVANTNGWSAYGGAVSDNGALKGVMIKLAAGVLVFPTQTPNR